MGVASLDLYIGASVAGAFVLTLFVALVYFTVRERTHGVERPDNGPFFYRFYRWFVGPVVAGLAAVGVTPNMITAVSLLLALAAAAILGSGMLFTATFVMMLSSSCDVMDGVMAREQGITSQAGAFFDSFADRIAEGIIFAGIAYYGQGGILSWVAIGTLVASFAVSYARARGLSMGVDVQGGIMQRPARLVSTLFATLFAGIGHALPFAWGPRVGDALLLGIIGVVGVLATVTAWRRASQTMVELALLDQQHAKPKPATPAPEVNPGGELLAG